MIQVLILDTDGTIYKSDHDFWKDALEQVQYFVQGSPAAQVTMTDLEQVYNHTTGTIAALGGIDL